MKQCGRKKWMFLVIASLVLVCVLIGKAVKVNQTYPQAKEKHISMGKEGKLTSQTVMTVKKVSWITNKEFVKKYGENGEVSKRQPAKILYAEVEIKNQSKKTAKVDLSELYFEKFGYNNGLAMESVLQQGGVMGMQLKPGQSKKTVLIYSIYQMQFSKKQWQKAEEFGYLVKDRYPLKRCWKLDEK